MFSNKLFLPFSTSVMQCNAFFNLQQQNHLGLNVMEAVKSLFCF